MNEPTRRRAPLRMLAALFGLLAIALTAASATFSAVSLT